jgi:hypothetical protein
MCTSVGLFMLVHDDDDDDDDIKERNQVGWHSRNAAALYSGGTRIRNLAMLTGLIVVL